MSLDYLGTSGVRLQIISKTLSDEIVDIMELDYVEPMALRDWRKPYQEKPIPKLPCLRPKQMTIVKAILDGKDYGDIGMSKAAWYDNIGKAISAIENSRKGQ